MLRVKAVEEALGRFVGDSVEEVHLCLEDGTHVASARRPTAAPVTSDQGDRQMCALATSCWSEMSKAGQSALSEAGPLEWLEMQGSTRAVLCAPVGGTAPFFVVAAVPAGAAKAAARASLDSLRRSLVGPMTAVAAAMGGDMGVARRAMAEASAAATGAVRPSAAADRAGEASPEAESTGAADDVDEDDGVSP
ncbi:hypothetical protein FNF27_07444 [Cafeteria roenbergensis]|uniref:Roadblock/LAMTOR2 domain-containing protein n=2 Tax=Cafeteria roenbergensis TaxID=33653 RepID=A0A5A8C5T6_CAFRO|nr:hypothetical protein FNF31_07417 [Cafeteria roenbergensis]KAA0151614.1 hypothetical protein FNF29_04538 [Cafeteria roenbergensis]KAA0161016.1 hypothetical protein FNF28_05222 [Cafeteria roenbergensis]KAA0166705.1 hypothetical protein FNF27_07444 [Cafeteria roenbergensis]|eukprot:KAA0151614.1 hypothetical protein FNF29_04538 [Cafeteria roenbergensis]